MKKKCIELLNNFLIIGILLGTVLVAAFDYKSSYLLTYCMAIPVVVVPFIFNKTIFKFGNFDKTIYYAFSFFAYFLGSVVGLYNLIWWYDVLMHFISGFVVGYAAIFILDKLGMYDSKNGAFNFIYSLFFAIGVAGIWEIIEFLIDVVLGTNLQHSLDTGVVDTMQDIICGTTGGLIFSLFITFKDKFKRSGK